MRKKFGFGVGVVFCCLGISAFLVYASGQGAQAGASKEQIARGEYLVNAGGCDDCHTPKSFTPKGPVPEMSKRLSGTPADIKVPPIPAGVMSPAGWGTLGTNDLTAWAGPWGVSFGANLTPDKATGIGNWTEAAFVKAMRTGKHKGALRDILPPMPWQSIGRFNDQDLKAMFAYLQTLKPIPNKVPEPLPPKP
jgi:mono/diheme cytochrome c family protein